MQIETTPLGDLDVLTLSGEFDSTHAPAFDHEVERLIGGYRTRLIVDLSAVTFLDSQGITRLIRTHRRLRPLGGQLVVAAGDHPLVRSTLKTIGFDALTAIYPDVDEAHAHFADPERARPLALDGVDVDETLLGRIDVHVGHADDPYTSATGKLLATYEDGLLIRCTDAELRGALRTSRLDTGAKLWIRFRQPMIARGREFAMEAEVVFAYDEGDRGKYRLRFTRIDEQTESLMREFAAAQDEVRTHGRPIADEKGDGGQIRRLPRSESK